MDGRTRALALLEGTGFDRDVTASYFDGRWHDGQGSDWWLEDPSTGERCSHVIGVSRSQTDAAVDAAGKCLRSQRLARTGGAVRRDLLLRLAHEVEARADTMAVLDARSSGIPFSDLRNDVTACVAALKHFAALADSHEGRVVASKDSWLSFVEYVPAGVVVGIVPWNAPAMMYGWKIGAAIAAGCPIVLKPSELTPAGAVVFADAVDAAEFPPGAVSVLLGSSQVGGWLVSNPAVKRVSFTGGEEAAARIAKATAARFTRNVFELGGKSPLLVFADCDLNVAAQVAATMGFRRSGQICISATRLLIEDKIFDEFVDKVGHLATRIVVGDALLPETHLGPVANAAKGQETVALLQNRATQGDRIVAGGTRVHPVGLDGFFMAPTVVIPGSVESVLWREELFAPVVSARPFATDEEAFALANDVDYGLAAGVFTSNINRALRATRALEAGSVWVNVYPGMHPALPHGGSKRSGVGRELGREAIQELVEARTVVMAVDAQETPDPFGLRAVGAGFESATTALAMDEDLLIHGVEPGERDR
jgi:acyl-CoA reductase-like NAD-dependent aldehyde dehydrogenase